MPTTLSTVEIPVELEYAAVPGERGSRDTCGAPLEPDLPEEPELLSITVLTPALESHGPAWRRTAPRRPGWYWLRRAGGEPIIRRIVEIPLAHGASTNHPGSPSVVSSAGEMHGGASEAQSVNLPSGTSASAMVAEPSVAAAAPERLRPLLPPASALIVLEPGEGPRSSRHVPVAAYSQVWQWAGPIPTPGTALPVMLNLAKLDRADRERLLAEISER